MAAKYMSVVTTNSGSVLPGATVQVLDAGGALVTTYTDAGLSAGAATSRSADDNGLVELYVADGTYTIRQSYNGVSKDLPNVELYDLSAIAATSDGAVANKVQAAAIGIVGTAENMGAFTSALIPDNSTAKAALEAVAASLDETIEAPVFGKAAVTGKSRFQNIGDVPNVGWPSTASPSSNIFSYLDDGGAVSGGQPSSNIAYSGYARSSDTFGTASEVAIPVAGFGYNDKIYQGEIGANGNGVLPASVSGVWGGYFTAYREPGAMGATHSVEVDIANTGATDPLFPFEINGSSGGLTNALQVASGGEATATPGLVQTASSAISILSNDPAGVANFDKGIIFHNLAIDGTDGLTGSGIAIAMATGHFQSWFNSGNNQVGSIAAEPSGTESSWTKVLFNSGGLVVTKGLDNGVLFQIDAVASAAAYIGIGAQSAGGAPHVAARGAAADIDLYLEPKGAGVVGVTYSIAAAVSPGTFSATHMLKVKDGTGATFYIPAATATW